jgi:hypothetical protein
MDKFNESKVLKENFEKNYIEVNDKFINRYGTAGFRNKANTLSFCVFSVGILSSLKSMKNKEKTGFIIFNKERNNDHSIS